VSTFLAPESKEVMSAAITLSYSAPICLISSLLISSFDKSMSPRLIKGKFEDFKDLTTSARSLKTPLVL